MADLDTQMQGLRINSREEEEENTPVEPTPITEVSDAPISQADYDNIANLRDAMDEGEQQPEVVQGKVLDEMPPQPGSVEAMLAEGVKQEPVTAGISIPGTQPAPGVTSRGEIPGFGLASGYRTGQTVPGSLGEPVLDFTVNTPENNKKIYDRHWAPYGGADDTEMRKDLDRAIGFRTGIVDNTVNPKTGRPIYDVFGGMRSGLFPEDADFAEKARIAAMAGAVDLVYPGDVDEDGNAVDLEFKPVPAVEELRYFENAYAQEKGFIEYTLGAMGIDDVQIPFTETTAGDMARALPDALILSEEAATGKFIKFMDRTGYINPYILRDMAFANASGTINFMRKSGRASDSIVSLVNLSMGMYDFFSDDENDDVMVTGEDGKKRIDFERFPMAANRFAKRYNIPVEQAESALLFSPDLVTRGLDIAPEILVDMSIAGAVRVALAGRGYTMFHKWLPKQESYGGAKTLEDAVKNSGKSATDIISTYLEKSVNTFPSKTLNGWMRAGRVQDLDIWSGVKMAGSTKYRKQALEKPIESAKKEYEKAVAAREKLRDAPENKIRIANQRVTRAEARLRRLDAESRVPPYLVDMSKESALAVGGAALAGQIAQDAGVEGPHGLVWSEVGGALIAAVAPNITTNLYKAPVTLTFATLNGIKQALSSSDARSLSKVPREARQWLSVLQKLDPEDYENVIGVIERGDEIINRLLDIKDPNTGMPLLNPADVGFTTAELINIPLLRVHQQALGQSVKLGDIAGFNSAFQEISRLVVQERNSVDKIAQALDRLSLYEDPSYAERFPELKEYVTDLRKMHGVMDADLKLRQLQLTEIADRQAEEATLYLMGKKIEAAPGAGNYRVPNYQQAFETADDLRTAEMIAQGADPDDILNAQSAAVNDRLQRLLAVAEEMRAVNANKDADPSLLMAGIFHQQNRKRQIEIDKAYRGWETNAPEDTYMDGRFLFEDIHNRGGEGLGSEALRAIGTEVSKFAGTTKGARRLYGADMPQQSIAALDNVFGNGAKLEMDFWEQSLGEDVFGKILEGADVPVDAVPFQKWMGLANFLSNATDEALDAAGLAGKMSIDDAKEIAKKLSLPISPRDMRMVASAMGDRAFQAARSRRPQGAIEPARTRENFLALAESEEYGFRADYFKFGTNAEGDVSRGRSVGKDLIDDLREVNTQFRHDIVDRIRRDDVLSQWALTKDGIPVGDSLMELDFKDGKGPSNWYNDLFAGVKEGMTAAQVDAVFDQKVAKAFGGKRVGDKYYLDANDTETINGLRATMIPYLRQQVAKTRGAMNLVNSIDKGTTPEESVRYLQRLFAEDPQKLAEGLTELDNPIFDAAEGIMIHKFDAKGNIISAEPLLNLDEVFDTISFKNLRTVNKEVAAMADEADKAIIDMKQVLKAQAEKKFSEEYSLARAARTFAGKFEPGADGDKQLYKLTIAGDGLPVIDELRQAHVKRIVEAARLEGVEDIDQVAEWAEEGFNSYLRRSVARHINTTAIRPSGSGEITEVGEAARESLTVDSRTLRNLVGDENGTEVQRMAAENLKIVLGEEHYGDVKAITDYLARKNEVYESVNITGEARALSIESWLSRVYSVARGVVSARYVLSEAVIQGSRLAGQSAFAKAIANPEIARHIAEIVRTGKIPKGESARKFNEAMITAIARGLRENEEEQIPTEYPNQEPLDMQQLRGQTQ